jgi:hypothetical protein
MIGRSNSHGRTATQANILRFLPLAACPFFRERKDAPSPLDAAVQASDGKPDSFRRAGMFHSGTLTIFVHAAAGICST